MPGQKTPPQDFNAWLCRPPPPPASSSSSDAAVAGFALQEHLAALVLSSMGRRRRGRREAGGGDGDSGGAGAASARDDVAAPPPGDGGQDLAALWQYEHLRRACAELNVLVANLLPECDRRSCPEMTAGDRAYMCAAHPCCAIDYCVHTVDSATALLNSTRHFPSRDRVPEASAKYFRSVARRLGRLFAHARHSHRDVFDMFEVFPALPPHPPRRRSAFFSR
ncbi:MAG: Mob1/phocein [Olpidium bornovanus]|uniref:Mob1/phocein n=1 Tax=Olpidium bornovanus TaxID=278681 RepID=A0A8H7ZQA6_9FUNG|nr:MAG: Mob1/phocein [Olpidium bornovanus]